MVVTFVFSSNPKSIKYLDDKRLNKQRIEANQILNTLLGNSKGWANHPAVKMWDGYEDALKVYINHCIRAWLKRGKNCTLEEYEIDEDEVEWPWWYGWKDLHLSHKANLLRKKPEYYEEIFPLKDKEKVWLDHGYIWPHKISKKIRRGVLEGERYAPAKVCDPIGTGAPAQYRWTIEDIEKWRDNRKVNPKTGKAINPDAKTGIYQDIYKAYRYYKDNDLLFL